MKGERHGYGQTGEFQPLTFSCNRRWVHSSAGSAMDLFEDAPGAPGFASETWEATNPLRAKSERLPHRMWFAYNFASREHNSHKGDQPWRPHTGKIPSPFFASSSGKIAPLPPLSFQPHETNQVPSTKGANRPSSKGLVHQGIPDLLKTRGSQADLPGKKLKPIRHGDRPQQSLRPLRPCQA
jgi:hypothetical protein